MSFPEKVVVAPLTEKLYQKAAKEKIPLNGTFELSPVCNFACRMCYVRKTVKEVEAQSHRMLTLEQWISLAEQARKEGMLYLLLTGGEPLLWPHFWELYEALYKMGFLIGINTNGSMIDEKLIERWKEHPPYRVNVTLYGATDDTYEKLCDVKKVCSKVKNAICAMAAEGITVKLNCSLTPYNARDLEEMIQFAKDKKVAITVSTYMYPPVRRDAEMTGKNDRFQPEEAAYYHLQRYRYQKGEDAYRLYLENILKGLADPAGLEDSCIDPAEGKLRCRAGSAAFWVTWDGYVTPCGMMPEPRIDLTGRKFSEVWKELVTVSAGLRTSGICEHCADQQMCHSCAAMAYAETGQVSGVPTYLCKMVRAMKVIARDELSRSDTGNNCGE